MQHTENSTNLRGLAAAGATVLFGFGLSLAALLARDQTEGSTMSGATHYMGLLMINQPLNLLWFMAGPALIVEGIAIIGMIGAYRPAARRWTGPLVSLGNLLAGPLMLSASLHVLLNLVIRLTASGLWRGPADWIAIGLLLAQTVPMLMLTTLEVQAVAGVVDHADPEATRRHRRRHAAWLASAMALIHLAMIFGMVDPRLMGWVGPAHIHP